MVRKLYLIEVAKAVADDVLERPARIAARRALAEAVAERRVLLYSARSEEQRIIGARPVGGTLSDTSDWFSGLVVNNAGGNKLDYYLDRQVTYAAASRGARDPRHGHHLGDGNWALTSGLGSYAGGRADPAGCAGAQGHEPPPRRVLRAPRAPTSRKPPSTASPRSWTWTRNGDGRSSLAFVLEIAPGQTRTLTLRIDEPAGAKGPVTTLVQPLVLPQKTSVTIPGLLEDRCPLTCPRRFWVTASCSARRRATPDGAGGPLQPRVMARSTASVLISA